jgi:hypothetical protein
MTGRRQCQCAFLPAFPMNSFSCIAAILVLLNSGCVLSHRYLPHESWPKRGAANNLKQFEGLYGNRSFSPDTGKPATNSTQLFVFILGPTHGHGDRGERVEFRFTQDENQLKLRLLDRQNQEIESATLQRGVAFEFSDGRLMLHGPFSGLRGDDNNFGPGFTFQRDKLHLSTTGGVLGSHSRNGVMLLMAIFPTVVTKKYWFFWPKITN